MRHFVDIDKFIGKFIQIGTGLRISKITLKKKNKMGKITLSDFKTNQKNCNVKTVTSKIYVHPPCSS